MSIYFSLRRAGLIVGLLAQAACGNQPSANSVPPDTETLFNRSCRSCHVSGVGGAPRTGDQQAWAPRIAQGRSVLLSRTVSGYKGMPAMGMCRDCSEQQLVDLIEYMAGQPLPPEG